MKTPLALAALSLTLSLTLSLALSFTLSACSDTDDASKVGDDAAVAAPEKKAAPSTTLDAFMTALPAAACTPITTCKQEKYAGTVDMMVMMTAAFGTMEDTAAQAKIQEIGKAMETDKRFLLNQEECQTVIGYAFGAAKLSLADVQASIDAGKAAYNGQAAASCLETLKKSPDFCGAEVKLDAELKMADVGPISQELEPKLDAYMKDCEGVLDGKLADGAECEVDYQCTGDSKCAQNKCVGAAPVVPAPTDAAPTDAAPTGK